MDSQRLELDLHRLELRFAGSRLVEPRAVARIAHSIERCGQIVPCVVVAVSSGPGAGGERLVLIDGYRRVAALRRLGRDTASVERWTCDLTDALLGLLARTQDRPLASIEEALLIRELMQGLGLSQHDLARRCGRDVSWISRRLQLLSGLPDAALTAVRDGTLSTRELRCWFEHYQKAFRSARDHMVSRPRLFIDALRETGEQRAGERLRDGPEGECAADLRGIEAILARLRKRVAALRPLPRTLIDAVLRLRAGIEALISEIQREGAHDPDRDP
jgi:ParB/RepB/Spo0J family partition protein